MIAIPIFFQQDNKNAAQIDPVDISSLKNVYLLISQGYTLSAELLVDTHCWIELYDLWIKACVELVAEVSKETTAPEKAVERARSLFFKKAGTAGPSKEDCEEYLRQYQAALRTTRPLICNANTAKAICAAVDQEMAGAEPYLRLRTAAVCLLANSLPQDLFSQGEGWPGVLNSQARKETLAKSVIAVKEGDRFTLDPSAAPEPGKQLYAATLQNTGNQKCRIQIHCGGITYTVKLPPYGILRAAFADDSRRTLVSLKGCISCSDTNTAVRQTGGKNGFLLACGYVAGGKPGWSDIPMAEPFWDAAADTDENGEAGVLVLTANGLWTSFTGNYLPGAEVPVHCYRAGDQWAWLYADGRLESNLLPSDADMTGVTAVVEDAERGLLVCRNGECIDYRRPREVRQIEADDFVDVMMKRFTQAGDNAYEAVKTQTMQWTI